MTMIRTTVTTSPMIPPTYGMLSPPLSLLVLVDTNKVKIVTPESPLDGSAS